MRAEMWSDEVVALCKRLVRKKSYSGEENGVVEEISDYMKENGFDDVRVDRYGSIVGVIRGKRPGKKILFDGHIDTVPVENEEKWTHKPFEPEIAEGKLYGRGTTDMKGAVAAYMVAAVHFARDTERDFAGEIYVDGVVHEECFEGVAAREISAEVKPDYVVIGEASDLNVKIGQRGRAEIVVETFGKPAHSANPEKGINAVYQMCRVIEEIRRLVPPEHPVLGKGILELTDVKSSPYPGASVVPEYCRATYDRRLLVGETEEGVLKPIQRLLDEMMQQAPDLKVKVSYAHGKEKCHTGETIEGERFFPGWLVEESEQYIKDVLGELRADGFAPEITRYNFCTNGSHYAGEAGIRTIGLGPSTESLAHTVDEYCELSQLVGAAGCYYAVMKALLK